MKRKITFILSIWIALCSIAQTQQGLVKTIGRPGKPGTPLSNVTIRWRGEVNSVVSGDDGSFSVIMTGKKNGDPESALESCLKALEMRERSLGPNHPDVASSHSTIGAIYESMRDYKSALQHYNKSLEIRLKAFGPEHPDVATSYNNIGVVYAGMGDYAKAQKYYDQALAILEKSPDANPILMAQTYNNIGNFHYNQEQYEKAKNITSSSLTQYSSKMIL